MLPISREYTDSPSKVLLVEGLDDKHVVNSLLHRFDQEINFTVRIKGGVDNVIKSIGPEVQAPGLKSIGVLVDANDDISSRWQAVRNRFRRVAINLPESPDRGGTIVGGKPKVGIWLMPDNSSPGELEDFVQSMVPPSDPLWPMVDEFVEKIPAEFQEFTKKKTSRSKLYVWLVTREKPGLMATAIRAKYLDIEGQLTQDFAHWMVNLFGTEPD